MALGTLAAIALGLGTATQAVGVLDARKARKKTAARLAQQTLEAKEAAKLKTTTDDTGAEVVLGTDDAETRKRKKATGTTTGNTALPVTGGLTAAAKVGL